MASPRLLSVLAALALVAAPAAAQCGCCSGTASGAGNPAAGLKFLAAGGDSFDLGALVGKQPLVLLIAGTDKPSQTAALAVQEAFAADTGQSTRFIGLVNAGLQATKNAARSWKLDYTVVADPGKKAGSWLGAERVPAVVFVGAAGKVVKTEYIVSATSLRAGLAAITQPEEQHVDPVCGMTVIRSGAAGSADYQGRTYYFCSLACRASFVQDPARYLSR